MCSPRTTFSFAGRPESYINREILVLCHGGPIAEPADAQAVLDRTEGIVGFYGASSMERLPVESAIANRVREFAAMRL